MSVVTLREQAREIASLVAEWLDLRDRASAVLARTASSEFRIAVVGEFKRGKSTLLNALVGLDVLPTGVLPVTAVPIELAAGDGSAVVTFDDGSRRGISLDELDLYTTESQNPGNRRG
ncbi:MAG: dynamin family protein, partial [Acidimicrobiales bacterium]